MAKKYKLPWMSEWLNRRELEAMTTAKLEKIGRQNGIELDKRLKKEKLVEKVYWVLTHKEGQGFLFIILFTSLRCTWPQTALFLFNQGQ